MDKQGNVVDGPLISPEANPDTIDVQDNGKIVIKWLDLSEFKLEDINEEFTVKVEVHYKATGE